MDLQLDSAASAKKPTQCSEQTTQIHETMNSRKPSTIKLLRGKE